MYSERIGGLVSVYVNEPTILNDYKKTVEINWSAIGSQSIEKTEQFIAHLQEAVKRARALED